MIEETALQSKQTFSERFVLVSLDRISKEAETWQTNAVFLGILDTAINFIHSELGSQRLEDYSKPESPEIQNLVLDEAFKPKLDLLSKVAAYALSSSKDLWLKLGLALAHLRHEMGQALIFTNNLAICNFNQGNYQASVDYYRYALDKLSAQFSVREQGEMLNRMGLAYAYLGDYMQAIASYEAAIAILQKVKAPEEGMAYGGLGWAYGDRGEFHKALESYERGYKLAQKNKDMEGMAARIGAIGILQWQLGFGTKAIRHLKDAIKKAEMIAKGAGLRYVGTRNYDLGMIYRHMGDYDTAIDCLKESLEIAERLPDNRGVGVRNGVLGEVFADRGDFIEAIRLQNKGLEILNSINALKYRVYATIGIGETYLMMANFPEAQKHLLEGLALANQVQNPAAQLTANGALARLHLHQDEAELAKDYAYQATAYFLPQHSHLAHLIKAIVDLRLMKYDEAREAFQNTLQLTQTILSQTAKLHRPKYSAALALAGLSLVAGQDYQQQAEQAFRIAFKACSEAGILKDTHWLLREIRQSDTNAQLARIEALYPL